MGTTAWVRAALAELGWDAPDQEIKKYIQKNATTVPQGHISLALRKLRRGVNPITGRQSQLKKPEAKPAQGTLFPDL